MAGVVEYTDYIYAEGLEPPDKCPRYDTNQSDSEASLMLEIWGMHSTPSLLSLPDPLWPGEVAPDRVLSICQIGLTM